MKDTKQQLLQAATSIFARRGFDGATVKEISHEAQVNVSLVSYYFHGKEGLYRACLEKFGQQRLNIIEEVLTKATSQDDLITKLKKWALQNLERAARDRDLITIINRDLNYDTSPNPSIGQEIFRDIFMRLFKKLHSFMEAAQKEGFLRKDVDTLLAASLFQGSLVHIVRHDTMTKDFFNRTIEDPKYRQLVADQAVENWFNGICNTDTASGRHS